ncbi:unnamed protein product [Orchesella dallaii]|uniref:EB domain-containing protein n=1 Tax=Orchesella dallaii TaxID=48710 RepID=A0ABP1RKW2_9HEXA
MMANLQWRKKFFLLISAQYLLLLGPVLSEIQKGEGLNIFLQFGDKCSIPRQGGESSIVPECDASKGFICNGDMCVCTLPDYFSYDTDSMECRKKLGKSCRYTEKYGELNELPFNIKCHEKAECILLPRSRNPYERVRDSDSEGFSMCFCKEGYVPTGKLSGCQVPPPNIDLAPLRNDSEEDDF